MYASPGAGCCGAAVFSSVAVRDADFLERRQRLPDVSPPDLTRPLTYSTRDGDGDGDAGGASEGCRTGRSPRPST